MAIKMQTTLEICCAELLVLGTREAKEAFAKWRENPRYSKVVPFVENFAHSYIYELGPESVPSIAERSSHALGDVESHEQLPVIDNFHTPFALEHLFHWYVEKHRAVPTWREFHNWMVAGEAAPH